MIVGVDASVAIKWFILEPDRDAARGLLEPGYCLIARELVVAEVANAMWRRVMAGHGDSRQASATVASLPRFFGLLVSLIPIATRGLQIAAELHHPGTTASTWRLRKARRRCWSRPTGASSGAWQAPDGPACASRSSPERTSGRGR